MRITYEQALNRIAERTYENRKQLKKDIDQRRTGFVDVYGDEFTRQGDANNSAKFYVSVSNDLVYFERFQFKLYVQPFVTTVAGGTDSANVIVNNTNLSVNNNNITPNPHRHSTEAHTHNLISGISLVETTATDFRVKIHGNDITAYLIEQQSGEWIDGQGLYPSNKLDDITDFYDVLEVASMANAMGQTELAESLLKPEFKLIEITGNAPFQVSMYLYMKYSHLNR